MRAVDVAKQLMSQVPRHTTDFGPSIAIDSITVSNGVATATTSAPHNLANGDLANITGALNPVQIDPSSWTKIGTLVTFRTLQEHDLTLSDRDRAAGGKTITLSGATEAGANGEFQLNSIPNRRAISISVPASAPASITGSPIVEDGGRGIYNGLQTVSNVTANTFDYPVDTNASVGATGSPVVQTSLRIAGVTDITQFLEDSYTNNNFPTGGTIYVEIGDSVVSKNRDEQTDASDSSISNYSYNPSIVATVGVYIVLPVTSNLNPVDISDRAKFDYTPIIIRSLNRARISSGFSVEDDHQLTYLSDSRFAFAEQSDKKRAIYVHEVIFQKLVRLDRIGDTFNPDDSVAMRDVNYTLPVDQSTTQLLSNVDLDDEPLP